MRHHKDRLQAQLSSRPTHQTRES